ncbi:MAG: 4Fe-4S binding protein [Chloroflexi bacterium]|nr:4Fe-4S binding protein [Chloroflexota bacterium]
MSQPVPIEKKVLILGDAPDAGYVADELVRLGYQVAWVCAESAPRPAAPAEPALAEPALPQALAVYEGYTLTSLAGHVGGFVARFAGDGGSLELGAAALVVATGNERYLPQEYGLPLSSHVLTVAQVQRQLDAPRVTGAARPYRNQRMVILLDLAGETSKETATEALELALCIRQQWHAEVDVFYRNLKVDTYNLERLTRQMRDDGIVFCRYDALQMAQQEEGVALAYEEGELRADLLILPEQVRPRSDTPELAALLNVHVGEDGYFQDVNIRQYRPGLSNRRGIFFAGRCHLDGGPAEVRADAAHAAANVDALLGAGYLQPEEIIAHVDSAKCVRCLTCVRSCPHAAVEIADHENAVAARVVDLACRGCGACVANCPVRAIELV